MERWMESVPRHMIATNNDCSVPSDNFIHIADQLKCNQASALIQMWIGHLPLNIILFRMKRSDTPNCPRCNNGTCGSLIHYLFFCPHYEAEWCPILEVMRWEKYTLSFLLGNQKEIPHLLQYISETKWLAPTFRDITPDLDFYICDKEPKRAANADANPPLPE